MSGALAEDLPSAAMPPVAAAAEPGCFGLSDEQHEVVMAPPGPLLVLAGAGSGKTRALTQRVARFLKAGVPPERVLLMTFTNQAARQMLARLQAQSRRVLDGLWVGTFHHLALRVLRRYGYRIGLPERFAVLDRNDAADLLLSCLADVPPPAGRSWPRPLLLQSLLSLAINAELPLGAAIGRYAPEWRELAPELGRVCDRYVERKLRMGLCDFDDLLLGWRLLLCDCADVRREQQGQFQHVFIDEYQDVSLVQSVLCDDLARGHGHLTAVGDDAQSIYRFRGAELASLLTFTERWPAARVLHLSTNYRSGPDIVALCNRSIACNAQGAPRPPMRAALGRSVSGIPPAQPLAELSQRPALVSLPDARVQAVFVVQRIAELLASGRAAADIAILYRHHRHARELQVELLRAQIPYRLRSGPRLAEQTHIKDVLAFLRLCQNPRDQLAWGRVLRQVPGVGDTGRARLLLALAQQAERGEVPTLDHTVLAQVRPHCRGPLRELAGLLTELAALRDQLAAQLAAGGDPGELPARLLDLVLERHYRAYASHAYADAGQRLVDLDGLRRGARGRAQQGTLPLGPRAAELSLADYLSALAAGDELDAAAAARARGEIVLSTVHQAKGLEWGAVFVLWLCEGHFPSAAALLEADEEGGLQAAEAEERRLFYVAVTRAQKELYLCYPSAAATQGALRMSRFLRELDGHDAPFERWAIQVT
jgi:DNA helicase-2/ATP-dependent DNA helicase PcrA